MLSLRTVAIAAVCAFIVPSVALATGSRIDRHERREKVEAPAEEKVWYVAHGAETMGPLSTDELIAAAKAGKIKADSQVYRADAGWRAASAVPELSGVLS